MAIVQEGTPSLYENSSSTTVVIPYPAGIVAGELLLVHTAGNNSFTPTGPVDWTLADAKLYGATTGVFYKVADGTESGSATFTVNSAANRSTGIMERWSGVDTTNPLDVTPVAASGFGTTLTTPSITTVTADCMLVHTVSVGAAGSTQINTLAGVTKISGGGDGGGRRNFAGYESQASIGASGSRTWTQTGTSSLNWSGITIALRPTGAPATPVLNSCVNDIPNQTTMVVKVNTTNASSVRLKVGTDSAVTTGIIYGSATTPDANSNSELTVSGLSPNTTYYYRVAMTNSGVETLDSYTDVGKFKTDYNGAMNFTIGFGSCEANTFESLSFGAIATKNPDLFLHLGDEYYSDGSGTDLANFVTKMTNKKNQPNKQKIYRQSGTSITPSDHDGMNNNTNAGSDATAWTNYNTAYRRVNPTTDLPSSGVYKSFRRGRVRFIRIDRRSFATIASATDDSSKTSLGATQKAWFKNEIDIATEPLIIIQNPDPWIGSAVAGDDGWAGYITERTELANYIAASGKNVIMLGGDMHSLAADNGTNSPGGIYMFAASPFEQDSSIKGGPYSEGTYPTTAGVASDQYGWIDITDDGSTITAAFTGYSSDNTSRITLTKTVVTELVTSPTGIPSAEAWGTPSNTLDLSVGPTGIISAEAWGSPSNTLAVTNNPTGIVTAEAWGTPSNTLGAITTTPDGIASSEVWGNPTNNIAGGNLTYTPDGIVSAEVWGTAANTYGAVSNTPDGITSGEAWGVTKIFMGNSMVLPKPFSDYSTGDLEYEFYKRQSGLAEGTFNDHKYNFMRNELGGIEGTLDDIEYEYWKSRSGLSGKRYSLADHRIATFEQTNPGGFNDDGRTYFSQFFS